MHIVFFNRLPKQLLQANNCFVAGKLQNVPSRDIPGPVLEKIVESVREDETHCSFRKGYRVVHQGEFFFSAEYTRCKKRNGFMVMYQKPDTQGDYFGQIQYFVLVEPSMDVFAVIHPFARDVAHDRFCHLIPIKPVERYV